MTPEQERILREYAAKYDGPLVVVEPPRPEAVAALLAERGDLLAFKAVHGSEACAMERRAGNGPCGACRLCVLDAEAERDAALAKLGAVSEIVEKHHDHLPPGSLAELRATLASTPEIVAVWDSVHVEGTGHHIDFLHGEPVRAIIVKAQKKEDGND